MAQTFVGVNNPVTVKKWQAAVTLDVSQKSYFNKRFLGMASEGESTKMPIKVLLDLQQSEGDTITYNVITELKATAIEGDNQLRGKAESQKILSDKVVIDQARTAVSTGGKMTRKRTLINLRNVARQQISNYWGRVQDENFFVYLSGARGVNPNFTYPLGWKGRASNPLTPPDQYHQLFGQGAGNPLPTSNSTLQSTDIMSLDLITRAKVLADSQGGGATNIAVLQPCAYGGEEAMGMEETFVMVMSTYQEQDLRTNTTTGQWVDIQKSLATALGNKSPLVTGSMGMWDKVVLHSHRNAIRFNNWGAAGNIFGNRALFMGANAGAIAYGSPGNDMRFDWMEALEDHGNELVIASSCIFGVKKCSFDYGNGISQDIGVFALDTATSRQII